jgi:16S rRNA (cytosine1402-N4)-methyltransferase
MLGEGGILVLISFHSLEDRIVKKFFSLYSNLNPNPSRYLPLKNKETSLFTILSNKSLTPSSREISQNIRSRSAKLRYAVRNKNSFFYPHDFKKRFDNLFKIEEMHL